MPTLWVSVWYAATRIARMPTQTLTDARCRAAKPSAKLIKLFDGGGLHLAVLPSGVKVWRIAYRLNGKPKTISLGPYPDVSLAQARTKLADVRLRRAAVALLRLLPWLAVGHAHAGHMRPNPSVKRSTNSRRLRWRVGSSVSCHSSSRAVGARLPRTLERINSRRPSCRRHIRQRSSRPGAH